MSETTQYRRSRADRIALTIFITVGVAILFGTALSVYGRISIVLSGQKAPIDVHPVDMHFKSAIGSSEELTSLQVDAATVTMPLPKELVGLEVLAQIIYFGTVATVAICLVFLGMRVLRGKIFGRASTTLAATAGIVGFTGAYVAVALRGSIGGSVLFELSGNKDGGFVFSTVDPAVYVLPAFALAVILTAFTVGARMQRETEGLI